ncbi:MAG TPA: hypothetical protein VFF15_03265 [Flavobacteriaceae bacterium]|nr:hypothetical protein [Flavobacteriaceae bacterium]
MIPQKNHQNHKDFETKRRLFLQKDLLNLLEWMEYIEYIHHEICTLARIENQLIKKETIANKIKGFRRKNTLTLSVFCKYEQEIKTDLEYSHTDYDLHRTKEHEKQRAVFLNLVKEYKILKQEIYDQLLQFKRT